MCLTGAATSVSLVTRLALILDFHVVKLDPSVKTYQVVGNFCSFVARVRQHHSLPKPLNIKERHLDCIAADALFPRFLVHQSGSRPTVHHNVLQSHDHLAKVRPLHNTQGLL